MDDFWFGEKVILTMLLNFIGFQVVSLFLFVILSIRIKTISCSKQFDTQKYFQFYRYNAIN
jgi:hypothetical protein